MKRALMLFSLITLFAVNVFAQDDVEILKKDDASGIYYYEEVVQAQGLKQDELFKRAKAWVLAKLKTEDNNIKFDEKDFSMVNTGAIKVDRKSFFTIAIQDGAFDFKLHIWCKDDRYKMRIDNIMFYLLMNMGPEVGLTRKTDAYEDLKDNKQGVYLKKQANTKLAALVATLKQDMTKAPAEVKQNNDW